MYIHYVYNASLCVVYFISCITLCYCCTPTLKYLLNWRGTSFHILFSRTIHIFHFSTYLPPYQWDELRMLNSIIKLGTYPSKISPKSPFPTLPPFFGTCRYVYLLPGARDTRDPLKLNDSTAINNASDAKTSHQRHPPQLPDFQLPDFQLTAVCVASRMITIRQFHCKCSV